MIEKFENWMNGKMVRFQQDHPGAEIIEGLLVKQNMSWYVVHNGTIIGGCPGIMPSGYKYGWYVGYDRSSYVKMIEFIDSNQTHIPFL